jgi:hypothetical protein
MIYNLLKKSDWSFLLDFVSPAFFKVIPPLELLSNATALAKRSQETALYRRAQNDLTAKTEKLFLHLKCVDGTIQLRRMEEGLLPVAQASLEKKQRLAQILVELYFAQFYAKEAFFLDFRLSQFALKDEFFIWSPAALLGVFSPAFSAAMRNLYAGYYGNNPDLMKAALTELNLDWAFDVFIHHFGEGEQTEVHFKVSHFVETFHEIFMLCKVKKKSLRGEFVQLGVVLGLMYDSLETLGVPLNVRSAYVRISTLLDAPP